MLQKLLLQEEAGKSVIECIKGINMKDVVYMSAAAWDDIPSLNLTRSWNKLLDGEKGTEKPQDGDADQESVEALRPQPY